MQQWDLLWTKSVYAIRAARALRPGQLVSAIAGLNCLSMKKRMVQTLRMVGLRARAVWRCTCAGALVCCRRVYTCMTTTGGPAGACSRAPASLCAGAPPTSVGVHSMQTRRRASAHRRSSRALTGGDSWWSCRPTADSITLGSPVGASTSWVLPSM
jgi:hypothetical protein